MVKYAEDAPDDYEPEFFKTCGPTALQMCEAGEGNKKLRVKVRPSAPCSASPRRRRPLVHLLYLPPISQVGGISTKHASLNMIYNGFESLMEVRGERTDWPSAPQPLINLSFLTPSRRACTTSCLCGWARANPPSRSPRRSRARTTSRWPRSSRASVAPSAPSRTTSPSSPRAFASRPQSPRRRPSPPPASASSSAPTRSPPSRRAPRPSTYIKKKCSSTFNRWSKVRSHRSAPVLCMCVCFFCTHPPRFPTHATRRWRPPPPGPWLRRHGQIRPWCRARPRPHGRGPLPLQRRL